MTTERRRCIHCCRQYAYHPSGDSSPENDDRYCPTCMTVILNALRSIPPAYERVVEDVTDPAEINAVLITKMKTAASIAARRATGALVAERMGMPLFDMKSDAVLHSFPVQHNEQEYLVRVWSDDREPPKVERLVWKAREKDTQK